MDRFFCGTNGCRREPSTETLGDSGSQFGDRGNGYFYGWNTNNTGTAFERHFPFSPDRRYDTGVYLQKVGVSSTLEIVISYS